MHIRDRKNEKKMKRKRRARSAHNNGGVKKSFMIKFLIYVIESFKYGIGNKYDLHTQTELNVKPKYGSAPVANKPTTIVVLLKHISTNIPTTPDDM